MMHTEKIDGVTLSVIRARLEVITDEMDVALFRTALSPVIADSHDACHGIYHPEHGGTIAQGSHGHPIFVGAMAHAVKQLLASRHAADMKPGDMFLVNDPYISGSHVQDVKVIAPVFVDGRVICYVGGCGHWIDIGGPVPGNWNPGARSIFQEGLRLPIVKIAAQGEICRDVLDIIVANVRLPDWATSDLLSEIQVLAAGVRHVTALCGEFGVPTLQNAVAAIISRTASMMRKEIGALPDGTYSFTGFLDNDGVKPEPLEINLDVNISGQKLTLDFSRTRDRARGPYNISRPTLEAACFVGLKHIFSDVPANIGVMEPVEIIAPAGSLLSVEWPEAVGAYTEVSLRVIDTVMGAFIGAMPERLWGCAFNTVCSLVISGRQSGRTYVTFLYFGGGLGGTATNDGMNHSASALSNSFMASAEQVEARYPLRLRQWALRPDSGGAGEFRGGLGSVYEVELVGEDAEAFFVGEKAVVPPYGVQGGGDAAATEVEFWLNGSKLVPKLKSKAENIKLKAGDRIVVRTPGGGGYGDPIKRSSARIQRDLELGYVTPAGADR